MVATSQKQKGDMVAGEYREGSNSVADNSAPQNVGRETSQPEGTMKAEVVYVDPGASTAEIDALRTGQRNVIHVDSAPVSAEDVDGLRTPGHDIVYADASQPKALVEKERSEAEEDYEEYGEEVH